MLLEGALMAIAEAKGHMADRRILERGHAVSKAASILGGLSGNLNMEAGGPVALRLRRVYRHLIWRLHLSHLRNDPSILDEVGERLIVLKGAWLSAK
jgi:flagellar protein FliS